MQPGVDLQSLAAGKYRLSCPACGRGPKDRTLGATIERAGVGVAHCFRCGHVEAHRPRQPSFVRRPVAAAVQPLVPQQEGLALPWLRVWDDECLPLSDGDRSVGRIALDYLNAREAAIPPTDGDLRWHPRLRHRPSGYEGPALVALITDAVTRKPLSLHFTWVMADGTKAPIDPPRLLLAGHRKAGGVIRLWPDESVTYGLGVGEGIESSLTLARVLKPVWACIDASNLAQFPVLPGIELLTIAADHDPAGLKAARACAQRWANAGAMARLVVAPTEGADLNDYVRRAAA